MSFLYMIDIYSHGHVCPSQTAFGNKKNHHSSLAHTNIPPYICRMTEKDAKYCGCLLYASGALARNVTRMAEEEFQITGLAPSYAFLVMTVNDSPGINATDLSATMQLKPSTVTRLVEKMEAKGLVTRKSVGKFTEIYPTDKSRALNMRLHEAWVNFYKRYSALLGEADAQQLTAAVYRAAKALSE
jgi:MarR family transcriptional regulator, organic hydroperoxide resistance regulator